MNLVIIASMGRCGIKEYSHILADGFRELGHHVRYIGVKNHNNCDLVRRIREVSSNDDTIIFEYEPGIFWLGGMIRAMIVLRFIKRKQIILSVHELAHEKYPEVRQIQWHLHRYISEKGYPQELLKIILSVMDILFRFILLRIGWLIFGWLPQTIIVHSLKGQENIRLIVPYLEKVQYVPHLVKPLQIDVNKFRSNILQTKKKFTFIVPGFLFRRKRITKVVENLPLDVELWIVGTESEYDSGYLIEIKNAISSFEKSSQVKIIQDYEHMEEYLEMADVAVFFYEDGYQSGVASLAIGAGKPCIFSDIPAFSDLKNAGLVVNTSLELKQAMEQIQVPFTYRHLRNEALALRNFLSPKVIAGQYLEGKH